VKRNIECFLVGGFDMASASAYASSARRVAPVKVRRGEAEDKEVIAGINE
jgi:hypothetical protein